MKPAVVNVGRCKYKGVWWWEARGKWKAYLGGKTLGYFIDEEEAARCVDEAARRQYGDFAVLNLQREPSS